MNHPIYLDYAATTPLDPAVVEVMCRYLQDETLFGNPSSAHFYGVKARAAIELAREQLAACIQAEAQEIIWTSGATESNNLAIKGIAKLYRRKGNHIITALTEHKAVLEPCQFLEKEGFEVTYLKPLTNGLIDLAELKSACRPDTILVSIMHVNNETGIVQDITRIADLTAAHNILLHVDAAQSPGKALINVKTMPIDLISFSAHKAYGPKGVGALYLRKRPRVRVQPLLHGGGHEQGMRSGTLPVHQIAGMGEAFAVTERLYASEFARIRELRDEFVMQLQKINCFTLNTNLLYTIPHILNVRFEGMLADAVLSQLPQLSASTASACQGKGTEGSYVLRSMGLSPEEVKSSIRFSLGRFTTASQLKDAANQIHHLFKAFIT